MTLMQSIICMNDGLMSFIISTCRWGQWLCPVKDYSPTHIGHWVFRQLTLFGGQNLFSQVRSSTADLTAICLSGQFTPRWSSFNTLLRSWCLHQGDHPSRWLSHPGVLDQVALMPFWSWCFQVQCHKWRGVPVPNKPKVRRQIKTHTKIKGPTTQTIYSN